MNEHPSGWLGKGIGLCLVWLLLECVAGWIHIIMMKKANICPYVNSKSK